MLLGFYDRQATGFAIDLSPRMAREIADKVKQIFSIVENNRAFEDVSEIQLARFAPERVYQINEARSEEDEDPDEFFCFSGETYIYISEYEPTGIFIDVLNGEAFVFWEYYNQFDRYPTPCLSIDQLEAIANNQPLPQE